MAKKEAKVSALVESITKYRVKLMTGKVLSVDPASGGSSLPGYSWWEGGVLQEHGTITLPMGAELHIRLQELCRTLREEFAIPDVLIVENLPPFMSIKGGNAFSNKGVISLHKSVGCIIGTVPCQSLIEVSPQSWRTIIPDGYVKSDENDALSIAIRVFDDAYKFSGLEFTKRSEYIEKLKQTN